MPVLASAAPGESALQPIEVAELELTVSCFKFFSEEADRQLMRHLFDGRNC